MAKKLICKGGVNDGDFRYVNGEVYKGKNKAMIAHLIKKGALVEEGSYEKGDSE